MRTSSAAMDYANVFYEVCQENKITDQIMYELKELIKINDETIIKFLSIPIITSEIKKDILSALEEEGINNIIINLMKILIDNHDLNLFGQILHEFQNIYQQVEKIKIVFVTTAQHLDSQMLNKIRLSLEQKLNVFVVLSVVVDPKVIGGIKFEYDGKVIDNTILKQLSVMQRRLSK